MSISDAPYQWGGAADSPGDCSGRMRKFAMQHASGMSFEEMMRSAADDYAKVIDRMGDSHVDQ